MNKLKTTFLRSHSTKHTDDRRSQQFAKKLTASQLPSFDDAEANVNELPALCMDELSETEKLAYRTWWKDLDPFSIGHLDNEALLKFVRGCCLPDHKLAQILQLFKDAGDGLSEQQFYAVLRLIGHAQNGRTISRDMVFLGGKAK
ncbi:hypothetical protein BX666DRAFT_1850378 [Dichotomocladium elegans]|nr:hypothetical protein BX666DRAFT_1850378 [Dichotomocladium elegans]